MFMKSNLSSVFFLSSLVEYSSWESLKPCILLLLLQIEMRTIQSQILLPRILCRVKLRSLSSDIGIKTFWQSHPRICQRLSSTSPGLPHNTEPKEKEQGKSDRNYPLSFAQGLVLAAPQKLQPYLRLSRIHAPIGTWLLFWPCTWGLSLASHGIPSMELLCLFGAGSFLMRGAGCTINDMWDRRIDVKVARTRDRPIASNQVNIRQAMAWATLQLSFSLFILLKLPAPCFSLGVASLALVILYPLAKRWTNFPQAVLGLTFNTGILFGYTAVVGPGLPYLAFPWFTPSVLLMYGGSIAWTLLYDTIYAHQDRKDDAYLGLGSTARKFGDNTKIWLGGLGTTMISALAMSGYLCDLSWPYYASLSLATTHLLWQITTLEVEDGDNCSFRFKSNRHIGWMVLGGILGSHFVSS